MTTLDTIRNLLEEIKQDITLLPQRIIVSAGQVFVVNGLSDIHPGLGIVTAGEFRAGNTREPGSGFTGVRIAYPELLYNGQGWHIVGVNNDILQVGIRATDGKLVAGGGSVVLDSTGISAVAGSIGGFSIQSDHLRDTADSFGLSSVSTGGDDVRFYAGATHANRNNAPFRATESGVVTMTTGNILGLLNVGSASPTIQIDGGIKAIQSSNYSSQATGFRINANGDAEFNNITARGALNTAVLTYNQVHATAGTTLWGKSAGKVRSDFTTLDSPATFNVDIEDPEGTAHANSQLFSVGDVLRIKSGTNDAWLQVSSVSDQTTFWRYGCTKISPGAGVNFTFRAGSGIVDYGQSGQGLVRISADDANGPMLSILTHTGVPYSTTITELRLGNLNGSYGYASNVYGIGMGRYGTAGQTSLVVDATNGIRLINNTTVIGHWKLSGDLLLGTNVAAPNTTNLVIFNQAQTYNGEALDVGDLLLGDNSAGKANILWDKSEGKFKFRGGTSTGLEIDTDGTLVAGNQTVKIAPNRITLVSSSSVSFEFRDTLDGNLLGYFRHVGSPGINYLSFTLPAISNKSSQITLLSVSPDGQSTYVSLYAQMNTTSSILHVYTTSFERTVEVISDRLWLAQGTRLEIGSRPSSTHINWVGNDVTVDANNFASQLSVGGTITAHANNDTVRALSLTSSFTIGKSTYTGLAHIGIYLASPSATGTGTIATSAQVQINETTIATGNIGLLIGNHPGGSTNYALFINSANDSRFVGRIIEKSLYAGYGETTQYPTQIYVAPTSHTTSRRSVLQLDEWSWLQDTGASGTKDFGVYFSSLGSWVLLFTTAGDVLPGVAGTRNLGNATYYWNDISYKTLTDRGCLGWFDDGVELQDGRRVSDVEALRCIGKDEKKKTVYGVPMLNYASLPKAVYKPAPIAEKDIYRLDDMGNKVELLYRAGEKAGEDGAELTALISIMLGAIKELANRIDSLDGAGNKGRGDKGTKEEGIKVQGKKGKNEGV